MGRLDEEQAEIAGSLRQVAIRLLGEETVEALLQWYSVITSKDCDYVVFVVRRCYLLVIILSKIAGKCLGSLRKAVFLTDAASCLHYQKFADYYREHGAFPHILFVDDILIHGRNLNRLVYDMERSIYYLLQNEYTEEEIKEAFVRAMEISIFARSDGAVLLREQYERTLRFNVVLSTKAWRELSSHISLLISSADVANASYIFSEHLTEDEFTDICSRPDFSDYEQTIYQGTRQYTKVSFLESQEKIKVIYSMRIIKNQSVPGYRALPFIFLPDLDENAMNGILQEVKSRSSFSQWIEKLNEIEGKRSINELLSLIFCSAVLKDFNVTYKIMRDWKSPDWKEELEKLVRNYDSGEDDSNLMEDCLKQIIGESLFDFNELQEIFTQYISDTDYVVEAAESQATVSVDRKSEILREEEHYFWHRGLEAEIQAYEFGQLPFLSGVKRITQKINKIYVEFQNLFLTHSIPELKTAIAYFLQLMDAGVVGLTSIAPLGLDVNGYSQFVKYGEQALLIPTIKLYEYIPMLTVLQRRCEQIGIDIEDEIDSLEQSGCLKNMCFEKDKIKDYLSDLKKMNQRAEDWNANYYRRKAYLETEDDKVPLKWLIDFKEKQKKYVDAYVAYLQS